MSQLFYICITSIFKNILSRGILYVNQLIVRIRIYFDSWSNLNFIETTHILIGINDIDSANRFSSKFNTIVWMTSRRDWGMFLDRLLLIKKSIYRFGFDRVYKLITTRMLSDEMISRIDKISKNKIIISIIIELSLRVNIFNTLWENFIIVRFRLHFFLEKF